MGEVKTNTGIRQSCKVSRLLFVLSINCVIDRMNVVWPEERWNVLMYADDKVLLAKSRRELIEKINVFKGECDEIGL